jgi:hypothetical protein
LIIGVATTKRIVDGPLINNKLTTGGCIMEQAEIALLIRDIVKDNVEISIYGCQGKVEVELYWNGELIAEDSSELGVNI